MTRVLGDMARRLGAIGPMLGATTPIARRH